MSALTKKDKEMLSRFHEQFAKNEDLLNAVNDYFVAYGAIVPEGLKFSPGIDYVEARIDDMPILVIGLPPISNYVARKTEYTDRYLYPQASIAV